MDPRLEHLRPETVDKLAKKAQAEGLSLDVYLNTLLGFLNEGTALSIPSLTARSGNHPCITCPSPSIVRYAIC